MAKAKAKDDAPKLTPWETWLSRLSETARQAFSGNPVCPKKPVPDADGYGDWLSGLSDDARRKLTTPGEDVGEEPDESLMRYCVVESFSGEYPVCRAFKTPESMARHLGLLERQDVAVWCLWGRVMKITVGPQRYLMLPDGETAIQIPLYEGGPCKRVAADLMDDADYQEDGFLGHPALLESQAPAPAESPDDEEKEDDGEGEEAGV